MIGKALTVLTNTNRLLGRTLTENPAAVSHENLRGVIEEAGHEGFFANWDHHLDLETFLEFSKTRFGLQHFFFVFLPFVRLLKVLVEGLKVQRSCSSIKTSHNSPLSMYFEIN